MMRPSHVYVHCLGCQQKNDKLIYVEEDESFFLDVKLSKDHSHIFICSNAKDTSEIIAIDLRICSPLAPKLVIIQSREKGVRYFIDHAGDQYYLATNHGDCFNFKLMTAKDKEMRSLVMPKRLFNNNSVWKEVIPHNPNLFIEDIDVLKVLFFLFKLFNFIFIYFYLFIYLFIILFYLFKRFVLLFF